MRLLVQTGQWIQGFNSIDKIFDKVLELPFLIDITSEKSILDFSAKKSIRIYLSIQIIDSKSRKSKSLTGPLILESDYTNIVFKKNIFLDKNGYTRIPIDIKPPNNKNHKFNGLIRIYANMDDSGFDNIGQGVIIIKIIDSNKKRNIFINPHKNLIKSI